VDGDEKGQDYSGARDFDSLKSFAAESLEVKCNPSDLAECSEKEQGYIKKMKDVSSEDRKKQKARLEKMAGDSMKAELRRWLHQRLHILNALEA
jgi:SET domain-containing protein